MVDIISLFNFVYIWAYSNVFVVVTEFRLQMMLYFRSALCTGLIMLFYINYQNIPLVKSADSMMHFVVGMKRSNMILP